MLMTTRAPSMESVSDDPIFAVIERHRSAMEALDKIDADHSDLAALDVTEKAAWADFVRAIPHSKEGLLAYIGYAVAYPDLMLAKTGTPVEVLQTVETSLTGMLL
jgi:hypothetical protein